MRYPVLLLTVLTAAGCSTSKQADPVIWAGAMQDQNYEIQGKHFQETKGYEHYGNAAEAISALGLDKMAEMYASVNLYGSPDEIAAQLRQQKEILGVDHDVLIMSKYGSMSQAEAEKSASLFAEKVIPHF